MLKVFTVVFGISCIFYVFFISTRSAYDDGHKQGAQEIYVQSIGHPMKYSEVPKGHYRVIAVVNEYSQTAVLERDTGADGYIVPTAHQYLLVTDMMPQQMVKDYSVTVGGTQ